MKLIVILSSDEGSSMHLFDNLTSDKFDYYLTANNKFLGSDDDEITNELNEELVNAVDITNPTDERIKDIDGIILLGIALWLNI